VLGPNATDLDHGADVKPRNWWRDSIHRYAQPETVNIIRQITDWDKKKWNWYSSTRNRFKTGDRILMSDFADDWVYIAEVADRTEYPTLDGRAMAPFCIHDCLHINVRWATWLGDSNLLDSLPFKGWDDSLRHQVAGAPRVPGNRRIRHNGHLSEEVLAAHPIDTRTGKEVAPEDLKDEYHGRNFCWGLAARC
jgi:hypothetical protein